MKVLAINASPRITKSATYRITSALLEGMQAAGAETELVHLGKLKIKHCLGCFGCWVKTPGRCLQKDDMADLLPKMDRADLLVYATPLYTFTMTGLMKDFMDRSIPRLEPWLVTQGDITRHPMRNGKRGKMFVVSACGFPEFEHFEPLVATFRHMARCGGTEYLGEILRPLSEPMARESVEVFQAYYDLVRRAGEQVIRQGRIDDDLQAELKRDLFQMDKAAVYEMANAHWKVEMEKSAGHLSGTTDDSGQQRKPEEASVNVNDLSCRDVIAGMCLAFKAEAAGDMQATYYFKVTGDEPGDYAVTIKDGACTFSEGAPATPSLTIETPSQVWLGIARGQIDGQQAFMSGQYRANGDFSLLMRMDQLFAARRQ